MNERMIELYREAAEFAYTICRDEGRTGGPTDHIWNTLSTGKFAELIVRECAAVANMNSHQWQVPGDFVLKHFGVEE